MLSAKSVICLLLASVAFAEINTDFKHVLSGKEALTDAHVSQMYNQFLVEYKDASGTTPSHVFLGSSEHDRKQVFANKVSDIIQHNTNEDSTF
jgi:cathepsin H